MSISNYERSIVILDGNYLDLYNSVGIYKGLFFLCIGYHSGFHKLFTILLQYLQRDIILDYFVLDLIK
jgi:hypothetical protein